MPASIPIIPATEADFDGIWAIFQEVLEGGNTYSYGSDVTKEWAHDYWLGLPVATFVVKENGKVLGVCALRKNRPGNGEHVANASFMVDAEARGRGIGRALGEFCLAEAKHRGFHSIVYNFVVSTNEAAVKLWKSLGFTIIGTLPEGFQHKKLGKLVDVYIMHQYL